MRLVWSLLLCVAFASVAVAQEARTDPNAAWGALTKTDPIPYIEEPPEESEALDARRRAPTRTRRIAPVSQTNAADTRLQSRDDASRPVGAGEPAQRRAVYVPTPPLSAPLPEPKNPPIVTGTILRSTSPVVARDLNSGPDAPPGAGAAAGLGNGLSDGAQGWSDPGAADGQQIPPNTLQTATGGAGPAANRDATGLLPPALPPRTATFTPPATRVPAAAAQAVGAPGSVRQPSYATDWPDQNVAPAAPQQQRAFADPRAANQSPQAPPPAPANAAAPQAAPTLNTAVAAPSEAAATVAAAASDTVVAKPDVIPEDLQALLTPAKRISERIEDLEKTTELIKDNDTALSEQRPAIDKVITTAERVITDLRPKLKELKSQAAKLGPAPDSKDILPEAIDIADERKRLRRLSAAVDGAIKTSDLAQTRARQLITRIQELRQSVFTRNLLVRTSSPLWPSTWVDTLRALPTAANQTGLIFSEWWSMASRKSAPISVLFVLALLAYGIARFATSQLLKRHLSRGEIGSRSFLQRSATAGWAAPVLALPPIIGATVLYFGLGAFGLLYLQVGELAWKMFNGLLVFAAASALARAYLQPQRPSWRLIDVSTATAARLTMITKAIAGIYAVDMVLRECIRVMQLPLEASIIEAFLASLGFALLLFATVQTRFEPMTQSVERVSLLHPKWLKVPLGLLALIVLVSSLLGYIALGRFIAGQVVLTGTAIVLLVLLQLAVRAISEYGSGDDATADSAPPTAGLAQKLGLTPAQLGLLMHGLGLILNIIIAVIALPLIMLSFGLSLAEVWSITSKLMFGFELDGVRISPVRIMMAVGLFAGLLFATRLLQRWLSTTALKSKKIDEGLVNSVQTGVGYIGFALAALVAISYGGIDITNLAIVAGALSVGIGFGLQSIVNNFVSGLILLVERPIKVGDLVEVGSQKGHVRRISVRSTEIETFDRASVIIPNAELITGHVINLTHRNALARLTIPVGVSYRADPVMVRTLLEKIAADSPDILPYPAPVISFDGLGASSLDFTMRLHISDVSKSLSTQTDIRTRVVQAFREHGVEIPYPQQDIHLRDLDGVKAMLAQAITARAMSGRGDAGGTGGGGGAETTSDGGDMRTPMPGTSMPNAPVPGHEDSDRRSPSSDKPERQKEDIAAQGTADDAARLMAEHAAKLAASTAVQPNTTAAARALNTSALEAAALVAGAAAGRADGIATNTFMPTVQPELADPEAVFVREPLSSDALAESASVQPDDAPRWSQPEQEQERTHAADRDRALKGQHNLDQQPSADRAWSAQFGDMLADETDVEGSADGGGSGDALTQNADTPRDQFGALPDATILAAAIRDANAAWADADDDPVEDDDTDAAQQRFVAPARASFDQQADKTTAPRSRRLFGRDRPAAPTADANRIASPDEEARGSTAVMPASAAATDAADAMTAAGMGSLPTLAARLNAALAEVAGPLAEPLAEPHRSSPAAGKQSLTLNNSELPQSALHAEPVPREPQPSRALAPDTEADVTSTNDATASAAAIDEPKGSRPFGIDGSSAADGRDDDSDTYVDPFLNLGDLGLASTPDRSYDYSKPQADRAGPAAKSAPREAPDLGAASDSTVPTSN